jgi:hypothetical protein
LFHIWIENCFALEKNSAADVRTSELKPRFSSRVYLFPGTSCARALSP